VSKYTLIWLLGAMAALPVAILIGRVAQDTSQPSEVVRVSRAVVLESSLRPGDDVTVQFTYCNRAFVRAHLAAVTLEDGTECPVLYPDSLVPMGCSASAFIVFRLPGSTAPGRHVASMRWSFSGIEQTIRTESFDAAAAP
jgi:hypothetical protein